MEITKELWAREIFSKKKYNEKPKKHHFIGPDWF